MEKIKVNMSPNPLDVQTIHASQNDGEARQWEFELHNNGELIDTSDVKEQLVFKAYKGVTEQLLPENGSTPTTSPFKGDIRYPQGLLADQEFTYRQSPTESDGLAFVERIKGNTLNWNQLVPTANKDFTSTDTDTRSLLLICRQSASPYTELLNKNNVSVGILTAILQPAFTGSIQIIHSGRQRNFNILTSNIVSVVSGHKYLLSMNVVGADTSVVGGVSTKDLMIFDLTQMGLDSLTVEQFISLFPLSYYAYNQGSLLSFNGNGIKTVGKNLMPFPYQDTRTTVTNVSITVNDDGSIKLNGTVSGGTFFFNLGNDSMNTINLFPNTYTMSTSLGKARLVAVKNGSYFATTDTGTGRATFTITEQYKMYFYITAPSGTVFNNETIYPQLEFGSSQTSYEPYTESVLNLPISQYFPAGMKRVGNAYDELTPTKATPRIGSITLNGSEAWAKSTSYPGNYYVLGLLSDVKYPNLNAISNSLILVYNTTQLRESDLCFMFDGSINSQNVNIKNTSMTTVDQFKAWLQANPVTIYYELKTPTETSFTTASLVTENAEIPLSNNDGVLIGKCTEQLSENPGFIDAKIKLSDADGECYSNKIQLHVERSPQ